MFNSEGPDYLQLFMDKRLYAHDKACVRTILAGLYGMQEDNKYEGYLKHYLPILQGAGVDVSPFLTAPVVPTPEVKVEVVAEAEKETVTESVTEVPVTVTPVEPEVATPKKRGRKPKVS